MTKSLTSNAKHIFLDVVGFTMARSVEAQSDIIAKLNTIVLEAVSSFEIPPENIIFLPTGDGICITLLNYSHPYDISILLAKAILKGVYKHNSTEEDKQRQFFIRIGINENVDNVVKDINDRKNVAGLGINMAQRTMNCGDGSQILVGQTVYEVLRSREKYMKSFRQFSAVGKHDTHFNIFQYHEYDTPELNTNTPIRFTPRGSIIVNKTSLIDEIFRQDISHSDIAKEIKDSEESYILGSGHQIFLDHIAEISRDESQDCPYIKILLMDPCSNAVRIAAFRSGENVKALSKRYINNLEMLTHLPDYINGKIVCNIIDYVPHCNIFGINSKYPNGKIIVHFGAWNLPYYERPYIVLTNKEDSKWFDYYNEQFKDMWKNSVPYKGIKETI